MNGNASVIDTDFAVKKSLLKYSKISDTGEYNSANVFFSAISTVKRILVCGVSFYTLY